jgi:hypothetical protein
MTSMEGTEGPEADEAWRALVAKHPDATVIDDFMIALPSSEKQETPPLEPEPEPDLMLKAEPHLDDPDPKLEPAAKQSPDDLAATPLSDPKTSSSKDSKDADTPTHQTEMRVGVNAAVVISEAEEDLDRNNTAAVSGQPDSPRTSRQKLTVAQSEAAEALAVSPLRYLPLPCTS